MIGIDTAVYYLAPERSIAMDKQIKDAVNGVVPECLLYSRADERVGRIFAMKQTLRDKIGMCDVRNVVVVWDEYLKSGTAFKSAIRQCESEACQHIGQLMIHRYAGGNGSVVLPYEWHTSFDCGMDLIVGETEILLNTYRKGDL